MKTSFFAVLLLLLAIGLPLASARADSTQQNGSPGAQGTEGTNPTHQDQNVTGPNGGHVTDTNPANSPSPAHKKHHKKKIAMSSST